MTDRVAADELRLLIERKERLIEEKKGLSDDIKDLGIEAKSRGYDIKTIDKVIKLRAMDQSARQEAEMMLETYCNALGMQLSLI